MEKDSDSIAIQAVRSLGLGFDLTSDFRLRFAKSGFRFGRLVELDEKNTRDVVIPGGNTVIPRVSNDISCDKGDRIRFQSDVLEFNQMSELLNQKSSVHGKVPSGYFNAIFDLSGVWFEDATDTKYLAFDGYFISLYNLHLTASPLILREEVKKAVPSNWEPALLSRFIQTYGTHILVGMTIGGQDIVCVRQKPSSSIPPAELKGHLEDLGDYLFSDGRDLSPRHRKTREGKHKAPVIFQKILNTNNMHLAIFSETSSKDGLAIICSRRGGDVSLRSHFAWLQTVPTNPDAILFKFVPITSLLIGIPGSGYLSHAINLYLRYKPARDDLQYFLEFQVPRQWAPMFNELHLGPQRRKTSCPALRFSFMGPKLQVSPIQVSSDTKPVIGLRLYLEGKKCNRLAIHVQHLSSLPSVVESSLAASSTSWSCQWRGSDESGGQYLEPVQWKKYSHVCTSAVRHDPEWLQGFSNGVFVVTGAQLLTKGGKWAKTVLHLRLLFTYIPNCTIQKTEWAHPPTTSHKSSFFTNLSTTFTQRESSVSVKKLPPVLNSGVYPDGPPVPVHSQKLLRYVEMAEVVRGPQNTPGHWLATAAKLVIEGGKIGLHVKFALLNYPNIEMR
ncbi:MACPF domain-containing protein At1g14780-like [Tasmannia lanceolata]|uniref:MACPF domain-containing protein At1g14780-like n=1 Tax=Tasmannia lanceolata TaxID=3420 RepID=UPI00406483AF